MSAMRHPVLLAAALALALALPAPAIIPGFDEWNPDFRGGASNEAVLESRSVHFGDRGISCDGWEWEGAEFTLTSPVLPIGMAWRPPGAVLLTLDVFVENSSLDAPLDAEARWSTDRDHWSPWAPLRSGPAPRDATLGVRSASGETHAVEGVRPMVRFTGTAEAPKADLDAMRTRWDLWLRYTGGRVLQLDHQAFCRWLVEREPAFFEHHRPIIGYLQLRIRGRHVHAPFAIRGLAFTALWAVGGLRPAYSSEEFATLPVGPWQFTLPEATGTSASPN
jgi:hypothetical protein